MTPAPDDKWISILSTQGLAVVIALFCMFVIFPLCVVGLRAFAKWLGGRVDAYLDTSNKCINATVGTLQQSVETQDTLKNLMENSVATAESRHAESQRSLLEIKHSVDSLHTAVTAASMTAGLAASAAAGAIISAKSEHPHDNEGK